MTARCLSTIAKRGSDLTAKKLGQCVAIKVYRVLINMAVFGGKNSRIVAFEDILYVLVDWETHTDRNIDQTSLKFQWKGPFKQREIDTKYLPYALTKYSIDVNTYLSNLSLLK